MAETSSEEWSNEGEENTDSTDRINDEAISFIRKSNSYFSFPPGKQPSWCCTPMCYCCPSVCRPIKRWKLIVIIISVLLVIGGVLAALTITKIIPNMVQIILDNSSLTLISSNVSVQLNPLALQFSTKNRLNIDTPIPVDSKRVPLIVAFKGTTIGNGFQPPVHIPSHTSVEIDINQIQTTGSLAILTSLSLALVSKKQVPIQITSNPIVTVLGIDYPAKFNKTITLPGVKLLTANNITILKSNINKGTLNCSYTNVMPWTFTLTNASYHVYWNGSLIGDCIKDFSIDMFAYTNSTLSMDIDLPKGNLLLNSTNIKLDLSGTLIITGKNQNGTFFGFSNVMDWDYSGVVTQLL